MAYNPTKAAERELDSPISRGNPLNDPQYQNQQGYNNYDMTNMQMCTPRFGECTPTDAFECVPGDRHMHLGSGVSFLNQIDARLCSKVNMYHDYFFVPLRCMYPNNYEKLIPNPVKGVDLPWKALPQIPLWSIINSLLFGGQTDYSVDFYNTSAEEEETIDIRTLSNVSDINDFRTRINNAMSLGVEGSLNSSDQYLLNNLLYVAYTLSRGNLLDYLGYNLEFLNRSNSSSNVKNYLQTLIDNFFNALLPTTTLSGEPIFPTIKGYKYDHGSNILNLLPSNVTLQYIPDGFIAGDISSIYDAAENFNLSDYRGTLYDLLERGDFIRFEFYTADESDDAESNIMIGNAAADLLFALFSIIQSVGADTTDDDDDERFYSGNYLNPQKALAYQLSVAQYMTNDSVDNVYTSELFMQNLRSVMYPTVNGVNRTVEATFDYNGISLEYDYLTTGGIQMMLSSVTPGALNRIPTFLSLVFFLRRSLRYGDYFATGRPNLLAVGQLGIPVSNGQVNPIDVTKNLVMQRFLNAANWIGQRFVNYMVSIFGVKPSNTGAQPSFIAHRKVPMENSVITNTANNQGYQSTNLMGATDSNGFDVFIDDYGIIIGMTSFDVLPVYTSGISRDFFHSDRFDYFNPMLQNVGDQEIMRTEINGLLGDTSPFAYMVRYAEYKFGVSKAHGAFVNDLPGYIFKYPAVGLTYSGTTADLSNMRINPDFIRDKPRYFDQLFVQRSGLSPAQYYHFIMPVTNQHTAARKMQYQPPVLF